MPINLKNSADFWARIKGDSATTGDGTSNTTPARHDTWNSDIGSSDDTAASSDTGTFGLIALVKRLLSTKLPDSSGGRVPVDGSGVTQPVSGTVTANIGTVGTLATATKQDAGNTSLASIDTKLPSSLTVTSTRLLVDGSGVTQPVSGTVTANIGTVGTLATAAKQDAGNTSLSSIDTKLPSGLTITSTRLLVDGSGVTQPVSDGGGSITVDGTVTVTDGSGSLTVDGSVSLTGSTAAADNVTNPTSSTILTFPHIYNGTVWERPRSGLTNATSSVTGFQNIIPFATYASSEPTLSNAQWAGFQLDVNGYLKVYPRDFGASADAASASGSHHAKLRYIGTLLDGSNISSFTLTISNSTSLSSASSDLAGRAIIAIVMPGTWTSASMTFQHSIDNSTFNDMYTQTGGEVTLTVSASRYVILNPSDFAGMRYLKVRSGTSGSAVSQGGDRIITFVTKAIS